MREPETLDGRDRDARDARHARQRRGAIRPGTPFNSCSRAPRSRAPAPATRSLTVCETRTSPPRAARRDPRADHHREPRDLALVELALAGVDARADVEPELADALDDRLGAADRPRRAVEGREEAVAGRVLLLAAVARQLAADEGVVTLEQLAPGTVAELGRPRVEPDDVGEEHGREDRVRNLGRRLAGDEPLDLVRDLRREEDPP